MSSIVRIGLWVFIAFLLLPAFTAGAQGNYDSNDPFLSDNGRFAAFDSAATNLVAGDTNGYWDIFVRDRQTGTTMLISKSSAGTQGDGDSINPALSADGRFVAFESDATNLIAGDTNGQRDIFVRDRQTATTWLVSKSSAGAAGDGSSYECTISADGRYVAFNSGAGNLVSGDTNGRVDVFVRDRNLGTTMLVSKSSAGVKGDSNSYVTAISSDGRYVAFWSYAANLVSGDTNTASDIFVRDRQTGTTYLVSKSSAGVKGDDDSSVPSLSSDGRYVAFYSKATNLVPGDTNGFGDIFIRDRNAGTTWLVSKSSAGVKGDGDSGNPSLSSDGRYAAFESDATNLVSGDTNGMTDAFIRDRQTGTTWLVSKSSAGVKGDDDSGNPSLSSDGRYVAFDSVATNLVPGDTNSMGDVFVRDRQTGTTWLVSKS